MMMMRRERWHDKLGRRQGVDKVRRWWGDTKPSGGLLGSQSREGALGPGWGDSGSLQGGRDGDKCCIPLPACWHLDGDDDGDTMVMGDDDDAFLRQLLLIFTDACFTSIQQISILRWAWHCKPKRLSKHIGTKMVERMSLLISERVKGIDYFCKCSNRIIMHFAASNVFKVTAGKSVQKVWNQISHSPSAANSDLIWWSSKFAQDWFTWIYSSFRLYDS